MGRNLLTDPGFVGNLTDVVAGTAAARMWQKVLEVKVGGQCTSRSQKCRQQNRVGKHQIEMRSGFV